MAAALIPCGEKRFSISPCKEKWNMTNRKKGLSCKLAQSYLFKRSTKAQIPHKWIKMLTTSPVYDIIQSSHGTQSCSNNNKMRTTVCTECQ
jgi:hypothetical protein